MLYRVAILGDLPEYTSAYTPEMIKNKVEYVVDVINYQYSEDLVINVAGWIGVGEWAAKKCAAEQIKYHMFMPCATDNISSLLYDNQADEIKRLFSLAWSTTISSSGYSTFSTLHDKNYKNIIDHSAFIICFWSGRRQGEIYSALSYAMANSKILIDGMDDLKLLTKGRLY